MCCNISALSILEKCPCGDVIEVKRCESWTWTSPQPKTQNFSKEKDISCSLAYWRVLQYAGSKVGELNPAQLPDRRRSCLSRVYARILMIFGMSLSRLLTGDNDLVSNRYKFSCLAAYMCFMHNLRDEGLAYCYFSSRSRNLMQRLVSKKQEYKSRMEEWMNASR